MNSSTHSQTDKRQIKISISNDYIFELKKFKQYIIESEGAYKGNFQIYLINALNFYMKHNKIPNLTHTTNEKIYKKRYEELLKQIFEFKDHYLRQSLQAETKELKILSKQFYNHLNDAF